MTGTGRKIFVVLALLLVVASFGYGCIEESVVYQTYINDEYKFKVSYPEDWKKTLSKSQEEVITFQIQNYIEEGEALFSVLVCTDIEKVYSYRQLTDEDKEKFGVTTRKITVNGREGEEVFMKDAGGYKATTRAVIIPVGELFYIIHCQSTMENYSDYAHIFDYVINSLEISEEAELIPTPAPPEPGKVEITLGIPKTSLSVGEKFEGKYFVNKSLKSSVCIFEIWTKEGYEGMCVSRDLLVDRCRYSEEIRACEITDTEPCEYDRVTFKTPGIYTFEVSVYDYTQLKEILGVDSISDAKVDDIIAQVPLLYPVTKKIITVTVPE